MNIQQYKTSLQPLKKIDINIYVLDYNFNIVDEISGVTQSGNISIDANADIRRTLDISIALGGYNTKQNNDIDDFNYLTQYHIGDIVVFNNLVYRCVGVKTDGYIQGELPTNKLYWQVYTFSQNALMQKYWSAGNPYWFDKYIKVEVGIEDIETKKFVWNNLGIYLVNSPTIKYDASSNTLSFQAVDLMSKLTGLRNGYLEGITHQIPAGTTITKAIRDVLIEQGFSNMILDTPPTSTTPIDINIDIGQTAYEMLTQLRDINPNWEMFFDVNGVFRFQQIPSGNEIGMFGNEVWDKIGTSYEISTNFEDVKNYVEVVGKQIEPNETAEATYNTNTVTITLARPFSSYYSTDETIDITWYIGFTIGSVSAQPVEFTQPIARITVKDSVGSTRNITIDSTQEAKIFYNNETYFVRLIFSSEAYVKGEFGGYLQPRAIAFENNEESPFYIGSAIEYTSDFNNLNVNFVTDDYDQYIDTIANEINGNVMTINLIPYISVNEFNQSTEGTQWAFKTHVNLQEGKIRTLNILYGGSTPQQFVTSDNNNFLTSENRNFIVQEAESRSTLSPIYKDDTATWSALNTITLDFSNDYLITVQKVNGGLKAFVSYYPLSANVWSSPTTKVHSIPRFTKMVRGVCSGDEYDNIYSNDLVNQRAKYELYLQCRVHDSINITSAPLYWLDVNKVMRFKLNTNDDDILWIIKTISMDLSVEGTQTINAMRYYPLYNS